MAEETHCHADGHGPCVATDCPIAGMGPLRGHLRPCPGAHGPQHPVERAGEITLRYNPEPVDFDAEEAGWREFAEKGGAVMVNGVVVGHAGPAVPHPTDPELLVAPYKGADPWVQPVAGDPAKPRIAPAEPLLASDASRRFMDLHDRTDRPVHELAADAIHLAEVRGVEAVIRALGAWVSDIGTVRVDVTVEKHDLMRRIEKELGR